MTEGQKDKELFIPISLPKCSQTGQARAKLKPEAEHSIQVSYMGDRDPSAWAIIQLLSQATGKELDKDWSNQNIVGTHMNCLLARLSDQLHGTCHEDLRHRETDRQRRRVLPSVGSLPRIGPVQSQDPRAPSGLPHSCWGPTS